MTALQYKSGHCNLQLLVSYEVMSVALIQSITLLQFKNTNTF